MRRVFVTILGCLIAACQPADNRGADEPNIYRLAEEGATTPLMVALETTGKVDPRDVCHRTPLMFAAQFGRLETVRRLLDAGANVHLHEKGYYTALMLAAGNGHTDVVQLLAETGASVNEVEMTHGWTALIWAAKRGHRETVALLIDLGADPAIRDDRGWTARDWALHGGHAATAQLL